MHELTRKYIHPTYRVEYEVQAFAVEPRDPDVPAGTPWDPEDGGCRHPDIRFPSRRRRRSVPLDDNDSLGCIVGRISLPDGWFPKGTGGKMIPSRAFLLPLIHSDGKPSTKISARAL